MTTRIFWMHFGNSGNRKSHERVCVVNHARHAGVTPLSRLRSPIVTYFLTRGSQRTHPADLGASHAGKGAAGCVPQGDWRV
eukprot:454564-Amorphochlora_amoeboformis.AAC.1